VANTVTGSRAPTGRCSILSTQFAKCAVLLHMSKYDK
jgi:hypothetical protein